MAWHGLEWKGMEWNRQQGDLAKSELECSFHGGSVSTFLNGKLNTCYNAVEKITDEPDIWTIAQESIADLVSAGTIE
jgi:hypothetical protein